MADVAADEAKVVRGRLLQWEAGERPLAALSTQQQDTLFLLMEAASQRPYPPQVLQCQKLIRVNAPLLLLSF
jgi:hypothetical protein